jgi:hypothetical protein
MHEGQVIDRYEVVQRLGEGGMAQVWLVRHVTLGTRHALKVLTLSGKGLTERLVAEGRAQATLQHPNIVRVSDVIDVDGQPGLVMDYVDGPDLDHWIRDVRPSTLLAEEVFRGVLAGVMAAHRAGLVHRDLKPANVLMARDGDGRWCPKVADFGLAKAFAGDGPTAQKTRAGLPMGTPAYMSPEQIRDAAGVDERADIFSLGCILHELLTHERAFEGDDAITIFNHVLAGQRRPFQGPARLHTVVEGCLEPDRERRLPSCEAVSASLDGVRRPASTPTVDKRWLAAFAGVAALGVTGLGFAAVVGLGWWALSTEPADERAAPADAPEEQPADPNAPCAPGEGPVGWVQQTQLFGVRSGSTWRARRATDVRVNAAGREGHELVRCTLPAGAAAKVLVKEGPWLQLDGASLELPAPAGP